MCKAIKESIFIVENKTAQLLEEIMRNYLLLTLMILTFVFIGKGQVVTGESSVVVVSSKWSRYLQKTENPNKQKNVNPQPGMIAANKNFERTRRVNDTPGNTDPNTETIDGRSAAIEKNVQDARSPKVKYSDGFLYQVKLKNAGKATVEILFWEYQFKERANPDNTMSHQYLCGVNIKPNKEKDLSVFSTNGPGNLISVESLEDKSESLFDEKILINRVEYSDGTIWQRKEWNYREMKPSIDRALETPWERETCRNL